MILTDCENAIALGIKNMLYLFDIQLQELNSLKIPDPDLPPNIKKTTKDILFREDREIISINFSHKGDLIALCTSNKQLLVFDKQLKVVQNCVTDRVASKVCFSPKNEVIVADRCGDVNVYKFNEQKTEPELILGHLSILLDVAVSDCGKFIVTCDRDEKIRVSHYPNAYNILSYCLGHTEFVKNIKIIGNIIISASGDSTIRFWDLITGNELHSIDSMDYIEESEKNVASNKLMEDVVDENLEICTIPIIHMEAACLNNKVYIAISLLHCKSVQVHCAEINSDKTINSKFLSNISLKEEILAFTFQKEFFLLTEDNIYQCDLSPEILNAYPSKKLEKMFQEIKINENFCKNVNSNYIYSLYKKKFNNVEEYMKRKKQRLENK